VCVCVCVCVCAQAHAWVSRGGMKLDHAIQEFGLDVSGSVAIDIGCSTGILERQIHTRTHTHVCMCVRVFVCLCMCARAQCIHSTVIRHTNTHTQTHTCMCACARSMYTHICAQCIHKCVHDPARAYVCACQRMWKVL
jgi:imidazoleglycerol phosphate dehydratase HisB